MNYFHTDGGFFLLRFAAALPLCNLIGSLVPLCIIRVALLHTIGEFSLGGGVYLHNPEIQIVFV